MTTLWWYQGTEAGQTQAAPPPETTETAFIVIAGMALRWCLALLARLPL